MNKQLANHTKTGSNCSEGIQFSAIKEVEVENSSVEDNENIKIDTLTLRKGPFA